MGLLREVGNKNTGACTDPQVPEPLQATSPQASLPCWSRTASSWRRDGGRSGWGARAFEASWDSRPRDRAADNDLRSLKVCRYSQNRFHSQLAEGAVLREVVLREAMLTWRNLWKARSTYTPKWMTWAPPPAGLRRRGASRGQGVWRWERVGSPLTTQTYPHGLQQHPPRRRSPRPLEKRCLTCRPLCSKCDWWRETNRRRIWGPSVPRASQTRVTRG